MTTAIGSKWTPGHAIFRDDKGGVFYEVNSPIESRAEMEVQRAFLTPIPIAKKISVIVDFRYRFQEKVS